MFLVHKIINQPQSPWCYIGDSRLIEILDTKTHNTWTESAVSVEPYSRFGVYDKFIMSYPEYDYDFLQAVESVEEFDRRTIINEKYDVYYCQTGEISLVDKKYCSCCTMGYLRTTLFQLIYSISLETELPKTNIFYVYSCDLHSGLKITINNKCNLMIAKAKLLGIKPYLSHKVLSVCVSLKRGSSVC